MKPPKHHAHVSLIGTILIMWLMVGYVYLVNPPQAIETGRAVAAPVAEAPYNSRVSVLQTSDSEGASRLVLSLDKQRFQPLEPVVVTAQLTGMDQRIVQHTLASLLIEDGVQVLGPLTFSPRSEVGDYEARISVNPATGLPLASGAYRVVVRAGDHMVAAVSFEVSVMAEGQSSPLGALN